MKVTIIEFREGNGLAHDGAFRVFASFELGLEHSLRYLNESIDSAVEVGNEVRSDYRIEQDVFDSNSNNRHAYFYLMYKDSEYPSETLNVYEVEVEESA